MSRQTTTDPRIAPKEMIVTRNRSAQQKRQLRDKDQPMNKITKLIQSPTPKKKNPSKKKSKKCPNLNHVKRTPEQKIPVIILDEEYSEFYPNKLKRNFQNTIVYLKPKYLSKTVVKMNKRKFGIPQRGILPEGQKSEAGPPCQHHKPNSQNVVFAELSMEEAVRIVEDTESLDEEDLMEILTCPSPVWWEDQPDEVYIEEAIFTREKSPDKLPEITEETSKKPRKDIDNNCITQQHNYAKVVNVKKRDDKFTMKQTKLENLLGNIRNKKLHKNDIVVTAQSNPVKIEFDADIEARHKRKRCESEGELSDLNIVDYEMLNDLENIIIPIKDVCPEKLAGDCNIVTDIEESSVYSCEMDLDMHKQLETVIETAVPNDLPPLIKRPDMEVNSGSIVDIGNSDTIPDTNFKYITEDSEISNSNGSAMPKLVKCVKVESESEQLVQINSEKDFVTIYRIVDEHPTDNRFKNIPEYSSHVENLIKLETKEEKPDGKLNSFFKKCKNANRKKCKREDGVRDRESDVKKEELCHDCEPKSITVAREENVKYCLKCSSIFDTENCSYCLKSQIIVDKMKTDEYDSAINVTTGNDVR